ncbi:MAG: hypothetical protein ACYSU7_09465 [Planctomycetota bacterium]|jgi:hypothetical protein
MTSGRSTKLWVALQIVSGVLYVVSVCTALVAFLALGSGAVPLGVGLLAAAGAMLACVVYLQVWAADLEQPLPPRCIQCGYDHRFLSSTRCPECGAPIESPVDAV